MITNLERHERVLLSSYNISPLHYTIRMITKLTITHNVAIVENLWVTCKLCSVFNFDLCLQSPVIHQQPTVKTDERKNMTSSLIHLTMLPFGFKLTSSRKSHLFGVNISLFFWVKVNVLFASNKYKYDNFFWMNVKFIQTKRF